MGWRHSDEEALQLALGRITDLEKINRMLRARLEGQEKAMGALLPKIEEHIARLYGKDWGNLPNDHGVLELIATMYGILLSISHTSQQEK